VLRQVRKNSADVFQPELSVSTSDDIRADANQDSLLRMTYIALVASSCFSILVCLGNIKVCLRLAVN
jgi:hypothetical protein